MYDLDSFHEKLKSLSNRVQKLKDSIQTEEATKTSVIMPFFQLLDYDVFNPEEFVPEFTADVGIKKGEKVDYAIMKNGSPIILVEAKSIQENLDGHSSQLFRYFSTTKAKFAILTNGITYRFYTDLDEPNKMDSAPFFEFNLFDIRDNQVPELIKFRKDNFNIENIMTTASELKYTKEIKQFLARQWEAPTDDFVAFILTDIYPGKKTKQVLERFNGLVRKSLKQFVNDMINDKLKAALANTSTEQQEANTAPQEEVAASVEEGPQVHTTAEELEGYVTVKLILKDVIDVDRIYYRDNLSYFNILLDNSIRKWICRLGFNSNNKYIQFNDDQKTVATISKPLDILEFKDKLIEVTKKFA